MANLSFLENNEKFGLLYRFNYELDDCADKFFKDIGGLFFQGMRMTSKKRAKGVYHELFIGDKPCGSALAINSADVIKKLSHYFSDISRLLFDEFQSESGVYCPRELTKFKSIHKSIARGQGKMYRRVPVIMVSNPISLINPYYVEMHISERLNSKVKFLRGDGFVLEQTYNEEAANLDMESGFSRAFGGSKYNAFSAQGVYLNDNTAFIEKPRGKSDYLVTLKHEGREYGVRSFPELGIIYIDNKPDTTYPEKISVTTEDHDINYVMLKSNDLFLSNLRYYFEHGCCRFRDLKCKEVLLNAIKY